MAGYSKNAKITATGTYVFALDWMTNPFNVAWQVLISSGGSASFTVNSTMDPINPEVGVGYGVSVAPNPTWTNLSAAEGAPADWPSTADASGQITTPIRALQLIVSALTGTLTVNILQPLSIN